MNGVLPATFDSLYYRGCARLELGEPNQIYSAIEDFNQALKISPTPDDPNIYYKRAFACQSIGRYAEAIIDYSMFINYCPPNTQHKGYLNRGLVHAEMKQYDKALDDINRANTTHGQVSKYYVYCLARAQASAGHSDEAKSKFNELATICHDECHKQTETFDTHFYYGIALYELNSYSNALEKFREAFKRSKNERDKAETTLYIGLTHYALGDIESAKEELRHVLKYNQKHARALFWLGLIESQNNDSPSEALNYLTSAHKLTPHKSDILYERGEVHHKMGHLDACVHDKQLALQLQRTDTDASTMRHYYEVIQRFSLFCCLITYFFFRTTSLLISIYFCL